MSQEADDPKKDQHKTERDAIQDIELGDRSQETTPRDVKTTSGAEVDDRKIDGFQETKRTGYGKD